MDLLNPFPVFVNKVLLKHSPYFSSLQLPLFNTSEVEWFYRVC